MAAGFFKLEGTVRARPNHYETLGLTPKAASDEIARAFARETSVFRPHSFGGVTEVCMAYETLRDPIKRRAYDASLGLQLEPPPPATQADPKPPLEPFVHPALGSLNAALLRQPVNPGVPDNAPAPRPKVDLPHRPLGDAKTRLEPQIAKSPPRPLVIDERISVPLSTIEWKRTGAVVGGVILGSCLLGALAGWWSAGDVELAGKPANAVSVPLTPAKPLEIASTPPRVPPQSMADPWPGSPTRTALAAPRPKRTPARPQRTKAAAEQVQASRPQEIAPEQSELASSVIEQPAAAAPVTSTVAASLPLPNKTVARTIDRIGYACGAVASTNPVEGEAPGVYKVTCTSGQSFQAKPVNGRYRFRRLSRQ